MTTYLKYLLRRQGKYHLHSPFVYDFYVNVLDRLPMFGWRDVLYKRIAGYVKLSNVLIETDFTLKSRLDFAFNVCDERQTQVCLDFDGMMLKDDIQNTFDFIYINGRMGKSRVKYVTRRVLRRCNERTVIMFDGIYCSKTNIKMWNRLINNSRITLSMDCYRFGMAFMIKRSEPQHFVLKT